MKTKPDSSRKQQEKTSIEIINQVLRNLVRTYNLQETYVDDADPWMGNLTAVRTSGQKQNYRPISLW